jgi:hypothetical protein
MYTYPESEAHKATRMIKTHVAEGQLHPYVGLMLIGMVRSSDVT